MDDKQAVEKRIRISGGEPQLCTCIEELIVSKECCNGGEWKLFDFSLLCVLRKLIVGDDSFMRVMIVKLVGLNLLERVVIGKNCFTKEKNTHGKELNRRFYVKNCEKLRELRIGRYSFSD